MALCLCLRIGFFCFCFCFLNSLRVSYIYHVPFQQILWCIFPKNRMFLSFRKWLPNNDNICIGGSCNILKRSSLFYNSVKSPLFLHVSFCDACDQRWREDSDGSDLADFLSFPESLWRMSWMDLVFKLSCTRCTNVPRTPYVARYHVLGAGDLKMRELRQGFCLQGAPSLSKRQTWIR